MIGKLVEFIKPALTVAIILVILKVTGLLGEVSFLAQSAAIQTGIMDAHPSPASGSEDDFDYNFTIKDLNGNKLSFDQFKGKVVFLNLWATWCGPCRAEMPTIQRLYNETDNANIVFVMLSIDRDKDKDKIIKYLKDKSFTFPVYQPSGYLADQLQVPTIPTTFVISKDGKIAATEIGTTNFHTTKFKKFINDLAGK